MRKKRKYCKESDSDTDEEGGVTRRGSAIYFYADITKKNVAEFCKLLDEACQCAINSSNRIDWARVAVFIHSDGGDVFAGLQAANAIHRCILPVVTIAESFVASAATFLLVSGNERLVTPHTRILVHQIRGSMEGTHEVLKDEMSNTEKLMDTITNFYLSTTLFKKRKLKKLLQREVELTSEEAIKYGLVDKALDTSQSAACTMGSRGK